MSGAVAVAVALCAGDWRHVHNCHPALCCTVDHVGYPADCGIDMARICCLPAAQVS